MSYLSIVVVNIPLKRIVPNPVTTYPMALSSLTKTGKSPQHNPMNEAQQMQTENEKANTINPVCCITEKKW